MGRGVLVVAMLALGASLAPAPAVAHSTCVIDGGRCKGCGCKGGPGYRAPNGRCVGFRDLVAKCGPAPHARCAFENAPGTGRNRVCATHKH